MEEENFSESFFLCKERNFIPNLENEKYLVSEWYVSSWFKHNFQLRVMEKESLKIIQILKKIELMLLQH